MKARGFGCVYRPTYKSKKTGEKKVAAVWWIKYYYRAKPRKESSESTNRVDAVKLLKRRLTELGQGRPIGPDVEKTTFDDLASMLTNDYKANGRRSLDRIQDAIKHLRDDMGFMRAMDITADRVTTYITKRQDQSAANATINRELSALKRMFRLGERAEKVVRRPDIRMLLEDNVRKGFFEAPAFQAVLVQLPEDLQPVFEVAYITGWRVKAEILTRERPHLDLEAGWLRLEPGETKNRKGRMFPLTPRLRAVLERQFVRTRALEAATGHIIPWLFHRNGERIKSFRRAWATACRKAGLAGKIPHDFRRTAVRNLERAGVPRSVAMEMVGHRTESIYRRYAIADEAMLREGAVKLAALDAAEEQTPRTVIPIREAQAGRTGRV